MGIALTTAQVEKLAPDAAAVAAGRKLGKPGPWRGLGRSDAALWGECQGSALYQTQVALADFATKCSCPSRKFPCKHGLGLLFLAAEAEANFAVAPEPEWVVAWRDKRTAAQDRTQARVETAAQKPVDEAAQARRAERRHENIGAGLDQLDAWMADLVRQGLARVQGEPPSFWDAQARRLVDAQAPGLAARVRRMGARVGAGGDWAAPLLAELGTLALFTHAWRRLDSLDTLLAADVRRLAGLTLDQAEVIAHGDVVEDEWSALAEVIEDDERVRMQRTWLRGRRSGRVALVLQFAVGAARFAEALPAGMRIPARLAFWPSAHPQRALVVERTGAPEPLREPPAGEDISGLLARHAAAIAALPWVERELAVLAGVVPLAGERFLVRDVEGRALPLEGASHDVLFAVSGGRPSVIAGEWDGESLLPLTAWIDGRAVSLAPARRA